MGGPRLILLGWGPAGLAPAWLACAPRSCCCCSTSPPSPARCSRRARSTRVRVRRFVEDNPGLAPWLDRLLLFDDFSSPWFASIYLLLMVSLVGG
ncbi:cytochrome c biogenesis protein ResB [Ornithinimicrobium sp. Y1694]|uniref:cytochrome c biogenesis protein ResB n=1 Tax=Ornithinimicrobium sp. Y1694 TaxID=3418590 RepID=UPI003CE74E65